VAIGAGATNSGEIDWTVEDVQALENKALDHAAARAKGDAGVLAGSMGAHLGALVYVTNQITATQSGMVSYANNSAPGGGFSAAPQPLAIEPRKVSRTASVYAVYAIE
jgi:uncharacterized protein YggE